VTGIWDGIVEGIKNSINFVIDIINGFIRKVNGLKINLPGDALDWSPSIGEIPKLQVGGEITRSGQVMVGEAGPEILDLPKGAKVIPLNKQGTEGGITIMINADTVVGQNAGEELAELVAEALEDRGVFA
jgi:phage-related tail protein